MKEEYPELMVRVKLPSPSDYSSGPSGDTEYERAYTAAIFAVKPPGFEVKWLRAGQSWPKDSEGYTWVRLYCTDHKRAAAYYMELYVLIKKKLESLREFMKGI